MDKKPLILAVETATTSGSVALVQAGQVVGCQHYHIDKSHSTLLHEMTDQLMRNVGLDMAELDAVAVSEGPGSYTGLRIGVSAAKGFCYALDVPLIAINTLEAMVYQVNRYQVDKWYYCPMIDARRMEVYSAVWDDQMQPLVETIPVILDESSYADLLADHRMLFFGNGAHKSKEVLQHSNACFLDGVVPLATDVALLAEVKYEQKAFENMVSFEPFYLKEYRIIPSKKS